MSAATDLNQKVIDRFWAKVDQSGGPDACWPWTASGVPRGYGLFYPAGRGSNVYAHRLAFELTKGPIPAGHYILHACDNPPCCNPAHLSTGTHLENIADMHSKGRGVTPEARRGSEHPNARLTDDQIREIRAAARAGERQRDIAQRFGISRSLVGQIHRGAAWAHVPDRA